MRTSGAFEHNITCIIFYSPACFLVSRRDPGVRVKRGPSLKTRKLCADGCQCFFWTFVLRVFFVFYKMPLCYDKYEILQVNIYHCRSIKMRLAVVEICVISLEKFFMIESGSFCSENVFSLPRPVTRSRYELSSQVAPRISVPAHATTIMLQNGDQYRSNRVGFHRLIEGAS